MSNTPQVLPEDDQFEDDQFEAQDKSELQQQWFETYSKMPYKDLALKMIQLQKASSEAKNLKTAIDAEFDVIRLRVVPQRLAEDGLSSMNIPGAGRLGLTKDAYCTQVKGSQEEFFRWLRDNDYGDLIKNTVNPSSLKSLVKELESEDMSSDVEFSFGDDATDDDGEKTKFEVITEKFVNYTPFMRASVTKK